MISIDNETLERTLAGLTDRLLAYRVADGYWQGRLSSSALSTATASFALALVDETRYESLIRKGLDWLRENQNADGGWGDTTESLSNISTTMLCWSALAVAHDTKRYEQTVAKTESWLGRLAGNLEPATLVRILDEQYGKDRSFSAPILTMCALAGRLGDANRAWQRIRPLPFELSVCPPKLFKWLQLQVVSYALPALIAIGQAHYHHRKPTNPVTRLLRYLSRNKTLTILKKLQPENGGFLEATPLTAFVVMSLAGSGQKDHEVTVKGAQFLINSARDDGSWPIDTNLALWLTTLAVNGLASNPDFENILSPQDRLNIRNLLLSSQYRHIHPYTQASPGGWAWTNLPGAVPDADDTAGALIALRNLGDPDDHVIQAAIAGIQWLLALQNRDGGIPTFCRGWSSLPFDRSAPDLTAHAVGAMALWLDVLPEPLKRQTGTAIRNQLSYLRNAQRQDGSWVPLWFGNEREQEKENPVYGTSRVLLGLSRLPERFDSLRLPEQNRAVQWLIAVQNPDGGWGGAKSIASSIEETALAIDALADILLHLPEDSESYIPIGLLENAVSHGTSYLIKRLSTTESIPATPIGLYFAKLWYFEELYPTIFAISALNKVRNLRKAK
ncbi:MAG: hypothetical protein JXM79_25520 [Sedimentisphaerales bacterium]|nr:hypothetical protein [Sedimentisphaerales bacterium]